MDFSKGILVVPLAVCAVLLIQMVKSEEQSTYDFPYELKQPTATYELPKSLREVSGISLFSERELVCVQDEKANVYFYDLDKRSIKHKIDFGKDADYEGIAIIDSSAYVLRNDGNLYEIPDLQTDTSETIKHKSFLNTDFDVEGLCYDAAHNRLLLACKGRGKGDAFPKGQRSIFAYDLEKQAFEEAALYRISKEAIKEFLVSENRHSDIERLSNYSKKEKRDMAFNPSEITIHPETGHHYILSAFTRVLMVVDGTNGKILYLEFLSSKLFPQPEGMAFSEKEELMIASEGTPGLIYVFEAK